LLIALCLNERELIMQKPVFCFIDDSAFEISLFLEVFPKAAPHLSFITASRFDECVTKLTQEGVEPALFILDLYGSSGADVSPIPLQSELQQSVQTFATLDDVYRGLDTCRDDIKINEFLKRLFAIVNNWRELFSKQCEALDQSRRYGIANLMAVKERYPKAPAVMYTRKGLFTDAMELQQLACDGIFVKPAGRNDAAILESTRAEASRLILEWEKIAGKS
jgi:hypothetical protein